MPSLRKLEQRHKTGRSSRKFGFKAQFTVMAFIQLAARRSMRDGIRALSAAGKKLYHWGLKPVARSTFADANNSRPVGFFSKIYSLKCIMYARLGLHDTNFASNASFTAWTQRS
ncbi:MAG: DUF4372 domain-containing protein [Desulfovibrio sp.]|jgi:hypothetical protein|nr:DUF4372 domain-containing protein [Desulfovibrio sp.]